MSKRKTGKSGKSGKGAKKDDHALFITPGAGFDIRTAAGHIKDVMEDLQQPLVIQLSRIAVEFEVGCTRKEIIDGYNRALRVQMAGATSNSNARTKK
jgi:hypothetical protein